MVVLGAAGLVIPAFTRFRITPVIGFIVVGILVGPYGLGSLVDRWPWLFHVSITSPTSLAPFAELGIILLLFTIGLELSFGRLWKMRGALFGFGAAELLGSAVLIAAIFLAFGNSLNASLGLGLALALSSTALVLPIAGTASAVGRLALAMLLFEDLALVPIIFTLGVLAPGGTDSTALLRTVLGGVAVIIAMFVAGRFLLPRLFGQAARTKSPELFLAASLLVVILASVATLAVGLSPIVGALVAGLLIAETDYAHEVETVVEPFKGLALGVFLITVGMSVDLARAGRGLGNHARRGRCRRRGQDRCDFWAAAPRGRTHGHLCRNQPSDGQSVRDHVDRACDGHAGGADPSGGGRILAGRDRYRADDHALAGDRREAPVAPARPQDRGRGCDRRKKDDHRRLWPRRTTDR